MWHSYVGARQVLGNQSLTLREQYRYVDDVSLFCTRTMRAAIANELGKSYASATELVLQGMTLADVV